MTPDYDEFVRHQGLLLLLFFVLFAYLFALTHVLPVSPHQHALAPERRTGGHGRGPTLIVFALTLGVVLAFLPAAHAQTVQQRIPPDAQISAEQAGIEQERKPMFANPELGRSPAGNAFPDIPTPPRAQVDPLAVAQRYAARAQARRQEEFLAFASLSMPAESLRHLTRDVARVGGAVVLRAERPVA
ncbi:IncF plasmid conjugative transfer protein TrbC [Candidatus Burkholderia pumila]|uniref:IncF plasmid conjugative transfer protein TrbC n=1 Tax=Candidatus Burkholderia pumila TaxID=1090375 RepID=A0ABR5HPK8_9BURK|nr:IncF plasmid conjugative transfer protein TrbC [Candidatus Burkholderia pumila]